MANKIRKFFGLRQKNLVVIRRVHLISYSTYQNPILRVKQIKGDTN